MGPRCFRQRACSPYQGTARGRWQEERCRPHTGAGLADSACCKAIAAGLRLPGWRSSTRCSPDRGLLCTGRALRKFPLHLCSRTKGFLLERCERSEEHTSELQSLMRISYAVFCLKKKKRNII